MFSRALLITSLTVSLLGAPFAYAQVSNEESASTNASVGADATTTEATSSEVPAPVAEVGPQIKREQIPGTDIQIGDFVVGPGRIEVTVKPGESVTREVTVTNRIDDGRAFEFTVEDMSGSADGTEAAVLLGDQNGPYSLKDYVRLPVGQVTLGLGERARIPVTITMPPNAEPGGYYGAVLVSTVQEGDNEADSIARSPIVARIGTLFFITVPGEVERGAELVSFSTLNDQTFFSKGPVTFAITHENTGSVHLNPYGEIRIKNMLGAEVGYVEIDPWFVLPKSLRSREVTWNSEFLLGRYSVELSVNRGYDDIVDTKIIHIWVIPWMLVAAVFGGLFFLFLITRLFFSRFELKRK